MPRFTSLVALTAAFAATNVLAQFVTPDGTCGAFFAYTCTGGGYGPCCNSATSRCGPDADSCVNNCDSNYGMCGANMMAAAPSYSSSMIVVGGVNGAALGPTAASSANNGYTVPSSSPAPAASMMQSPVYVIAPASQKSSSMMGMPSMMPASSGLTKMPSPSMAMDGMLVSPSSSMPMPSPPPSGRPHPYSAMMMDPEYKATVTVTSCNKTRTCSTCTATGMPTGAWNGSMPMISPAMPTGTSGVCHKCMEGFTGGAVAAQSLKVTSLGVALAAAFGFAVLLG